MWFTTLFGNFLLNTHNSLACKKSVHQAVSPIANRCQTSWPILWWGAGTNNYLMALMAKLIYTIGITVKGMFKTAFQQFHWQKSKFTHEWLLYTLERCVASCNLVDPVVGVVDGWHLYIIQSPDTQYNGAYLISAHIVFLCVLRGY